MLKLFRMQYPKIQDEKITCTGSHGPAVEDMSVY